MTKLKCVNHKIICMYSKLRVLKTWSFGQKMFFPKLAIHTSPALLIKIGDDSPK